MIDALSVAVAPFQWGPILAVGLTVSLGAVGWMLRSLIKLTTAVAVLIEHNTATDAGILDSKKAHDEIIDNKLATSVLNETGINHERRIVRLESIFDQTLGKS